MTAWFVVNDQPADASPAKVAGVDAVYSNIGFALAGAAPIVSRPAAAIEATQRFNIVTYLGSAEIQKNCLPSAVVAILLDP